MSASDADDLLSQGVGKEGASSLPAGAAPARALRSHRLSSPSQRAPAPPRARTTATRFGLHSRVLSSAVSRSSSRLLTLTCRPPQLPSLSAYKRATLVLGGPVAARPNTPAWRGEEVEALQLTTPLFGQKSCNQKAVAITEHGRSHNEFAQAEAEQREQPRNRFPPGFG